MKYQQFRHAPIAVEAILFTGTNHKEVGAFLRQKDPDDGLPGTGIVVNQRLGEHAMPDEYVLRTADGSYRAMSQLEFTLNFREVDPTEALPGVLLEDYLANPSIIWYGPHACDRCYEVIVRSELEQGGVKLDAPQHSAYPNHQWKLHDCKPRACAAAEGEIDALSIDALPDNSMKTKPTPEQLQAIVTKWNINNPVGTPVRRYALMNPLDELTHTTTTTSDAWVMGGHSPVVKIAGFSGCVHLDSLEVVPVSERDVLVLQAESVPAKPPKRSGAFFASDVAAAVDTVRLAADDHEDSTQFINAVIGSLQRQDIVY